MIYISYIMIKVIIVYFYYQWIREQRYHNYWEDQQYQKLVFDGEKDMLVLDLPAEPKVVDGWKILPITDPKVQIICSQTETLYNY